MLSQVVLSFGIPFALLPLVRLTSDRTLMGSDANHRVTTRNRVVVGVMISLLNAVLIYLTVRGSASAARLLGFGSIGDPSFSSSSSSASI